MYKKKTSKIIILRHGGGELANQLWNYISIYAYGLESDKRVKNPSFFEYHSYFKLIKNESLITKFLSFWFKNFSGRRSSLRTRFWRYVYSVYAHILQFLNRKNVISSENQNSIVTYLPPTSNLGLSNTNKIIYFIGWLFRNPIGVNKFREVIIKDFEPDEIIKKKVDDIILSLHQKYKKIIGIHIRQADYKIFKGGVYFIDKNRVREIIDEYIKENTIDIDKVVFLITSDGKIDENVFNNLNIYISKENAIIDLFLLSKTDRIIGSDSSFGAFASWYGNIPHIIMIKDPIDWNYYKEKEEYFENKYSKMVKY